MSEAHFDKYDHYNFDEKITHSRGSGKQRSKQEAEQNKNLEKDGPGHTRKCVNNMQQNEQNNRAERASA
ncbi:Nuclear protein 1-like, partial [Trinorchestia longiramus]